jgi:hypothetical protein
MEGIVRTSKDINSKTEPIELGKAKEILQTIVSTHQDSITLETSGNISGFNIQQIREAALAIGLDLATRNNSKTEGLSTIVEKNIKNSEGKETNGWKKGDNLFLTITTEWAGWDEGRSSAIGGGYAAIKLDYDYSDSDVRSAVSPQFPIREIKSTIPLINSTNSFSVFSDKAGSRREEGFHCQDGKYPELYHLKLKEYQLLFKGMRWMFANMLHWNEPGIILPEQLDHLPLSKH